jgi:hypothetical protein
MDTFLNAKYFLTTTEATVVNLRRSAHWCMTALTTGIIDPQQ